MGVADVVARMDDETAELIDESMDEDSAAELDVAGALVVVWAAVVDMMDVLLGEEMGVEVEVAREEVVVAATPARAKD